MKAELLKTTADGQQVVMVLEARDGVVHVLKCISDALRASVMGASIPLPSGRVTAEDGEAWLEALPQMYHGSYLRARLVD